MENMHYNRHKMIVRSDTHLRDGAGTKHNKTMALAKDTVVGILSVNGDWLSVSVPSSGVTGWVNIKYLTK